MSAKIEYDAFGVSVWSLDLKVGLAASSYPMFVKFISSLPNGINIDVV